MDFLFQAEDGIRDGTVTGVQTCALPISGAGAAWRSRAGGAARGAQDGRQARRPAALASGCRRERDTGDDRSEERRVGKSVDVRVTCFIITELTVDASLHSMLARVTLALS